MNIEEYIKRRSATQNNIPYENRQMKTLLVASNALNAETGEVANIINKHIRNLISRETLHEELVKELGGVFWNWIEICEILHVTPEQVFEKNIEELKERWKIN